MPPEVAKFVVRTLVENAWRHRGDRPLVLDLIGTVLDLMIPADGEVPDRETSYGTRTGLWLLQRFRESHAQIPVVVFTNVDDPGVEEAVMGLAAVYQRKRDCGPARLVELIRSLTSGRS